MSNLKILFVGDLNRGTRSLQRCETLKKIGHEVSGLSFVKVPHIAGINKLTFIERVCWKLKFPLDSNQINHQITLAMQLNKFDLVWIDKGVLIYPWTLSKIKKMNQSIKLISCSEDDMYAKHNQSFWYLWGLKLYDIVFTTKVYNLSELQLMGAQKVELFLDSYDEDLHRPVKLSESDFKKYQAEVGFIGTFEQDRAERMLFLAKHGIRVVIYGNGWSSWSGISENLVIKNQPLYEEEYVKAMNAIKINLCFLRKINRDQVTSRSVEIPACGAFMLGERTKRHLDFFTEGKEAEFFDSNEELLLKIKQYLSDENHRQKIAQQGYLRCQQSGYSMKFQLSKMLSKI